MKATLLSSRIPILLVLGALTLLLTMCNRNPATPTGAPPPAPAALQSAGPADTPTAEAAPASAVASVTAPEALPTHTPAPTAEPQPTDTATPTLEPTLTPEPAPTPAARFNAGAVSVQLDQVVAGLRAPVFATHADDGSGRIFVVEKAGVIRVVDAGSLRDEPFLDIRGRVGSSGFEQGLLGLAFHPNFAQNGRLFLYYTDRRGDTVISRFQANTDRSAADPASEVVLLTQEQPAGNHNGGMLAFGPDGLLYAGLGDGGAAGDPWNNGQSLNTLLGKLLRIDVDNSETYAVPGDNPFVGQAGVRPEIWAYGLRNPWRFSFDRATGDLYIADVGQNLWEEVNFQPSGGPGGQNYGWKIMEGTHCFGRNTCDQSGLVLPVAEYDHGQGCSITGGYVYRGAAQPSLQGAYFYGDYCSGRIWALSRPDGDRWQTDLVLESGLQISSFGETEGGEVLVMDLTSGVLYRLVGMTKPPVSFLPHVAVAQTTDFAAAMVTR